LAVLFSGSSRGSTANDGRYLYGTHSGDQYFGDKVQMKRRVVVTGLGCVTSLACQVEELWKRLLAGESGIHPLRILDTARFKVRFGGDVYDWTPENWPAAFIAKPDSFTEKKEIKRLDRFSQFAMVAGHEAVNDSGLDFSKEDPFRCGVILGSGIGGLHEIEEQVIKLIEKGPDRVSPFVVPKMMLNAAGGNLSIRYGLKGINYSVATACASANNAIGDALRAIQHGSVDVMITGGTEAAITEMGLSGFQNMKALSTRNEDPQRASRPFDAERDGFVLSEGAGLLVVEELEHAKRRGARIYCELVGFGASADAGHITQPDDQGTGAGRAMSDALADAEINPSDIGYINAHGTSTPLGDAAETQAIKRVFGDHARKLSISSTKSQLGHTLGASGGIELVVTVKAMAHGVLPPTINLTNPDPACDLDYTPHTARERRCNYAMSNSFGFGGHNASIVVAQLK
jgi:3-oxoacyl-[acyl-carrier-protein] synthase II